MRIIQIVFPERALKETFWIVPIIIIFFILLLICLTCKIMVNNLSFKWSYSWKHKIYRKITAIQLQNTSGIEILTIFAQLLRSFIISICNIMNTYYM